MKTRRLRIYIDTNVLRNSIYKRTRHIEVEKEINWGGRIDKISVAEFVEENPQEKLSANVQDSIATLPFLAKCARTFDWTILETFESFWELDGTRRPRKTYNPKGLFDDAKRERIVLQYGRTVVGGLTSPRQLTLKFLRSYSDPRFNQIADAFPGARLVGSRNEYNQLLDVFHLHAAEIGKAEYLLTVDGAFIQKAKSPDISTPVVVLSPNELREIVCSNSIVARIFRFTERWTK